MKTVLEPVKILGGSIGFVTGLQYLIKWEASLPSSIQVLLLIGFILLSLLVTYCVNSSVGRVYCAAVAVLFVIQWGKQFFQVFNA